MNTNTDKIIKEFVKNTKNILKDNLIREVLFGSYVKNTNNECSDIDILIIVKELNSTIRKKISSLSSDYSLEKNILISPVLKDIQTWNANKEYSTLFYNEIENFGIQL